MTETHLTAFRVTDLKQFIYCPRILYYHTVLPDVRPVTHKMRAGTEAHQHAEDAEQRRSLRAYGVQSGERAFNLPLTDRDGLLSGELDMLITTETERIPVDYKLAKQEGPHYRLQLAAYAHMLRQHSAESDPPIRRGFLWLIPLRKPVEILLTPALQRQLNAGLAAMQTLFAAQQMPAPTRQIGRCTDCEFRRFCNDVL